MENLSKSDSRRLYSWWWDSHISPKNSKWLQENLTDMDSKVKAMIKLIEEDADSFARRAEMYYKKRPELVKLVEEFYRAYRALAERYDHATVELRQAHRTMAKAFPNEAPFMQVEDLKAELQTPEMPHAIRALLDPDHLQKGILGISRLSDEKSQLSNENRDLKSKVLSESKRAIKAESEVQNFKRAFDDMKDEKEAIFLENNQSLKKISDLEEELNFARRKSTEIDEQASKAGNEVRLLKEALVKLEAERDANSLQHKEYIHRIINLESKISLAQTDGEKLSERTMKAEVETQYLKEELSRLETEKEVHFLQYKQCLAKISDLEQKLSFAESDARLVSERADRAEREVKKLEEALVELNDEKEAADLRYKDCLEKLSKLEREISRAREDAKRLNSEIMIGDAKLKSAEGKHAFLETSNKSLQLEADNLTKRIALKDQELLEKHEELEKLWICLRNEKLRFTQTETHLQTLQNLHGKSQDEQRALTLELKNVIQKLKDLEIRKHGLEEEICRIKDENKSLNEINSSSAVSMEKLQNEIISLRQTKERLEEEVSAQMRISNDLQKEIYRLKEEIESLNASYKALMEQAESVKDLQDENSELRRVSKQDKDEKEAVLETNVALKSSLLNLDGDLKVCREKIKTFQEDKCSLVADKAALWGQLQTVTETMVKLLDNNTVLENSLSSANAKLEDLREKSKSLEDMYRLLQNEKSNLVSERDALIIQLETVEGRLESLQKRFAELEVKNVGFEKEKEVKLAEIQELRFSLGVEKQERESFAHSSNARLASLENYIRLLQEESKRRKKEFEEELDKIVNTQFEIFILKKFIKEMEEKNYTLLIECEKHVEASRLTEKLISELERENLEQHVESELLFDEIDSLKMGLHQVFKALESGPNQGCEENIENEQRYIHHILQNIEDLKCSLSNCKDDKQRLLVENSVLLTLHEQLRLDFSEIEVENKFLYQKLEEDLSKAFVEKRSLLKKISDLKKEKCLVDEENEAILLETLALDNLSVIFNSFRTEKAAELKALNKNLHNLRGINDNLEKEICILRGKLEMKEMENLVMKDSVEKLGNELVEVRDINDRLWEENSSGKDFLLRKEREIECLHEELEEQRIREENEVETWEVEAANFYFDLQISSVHEVFLKNKVHELSGVCVILEDERASKAVETEQMKERIGLMEREIGGLKSQLLSYTPLIVSLRKNVESLEKNSLFLRKLDGAENHNAKVEESKVHLCGKICQEMIEDENSSIPNGISDLQELQTRIKAIEMVVVEKLEEIEELKSKCRSSQHSDKRKEEKGRDKNFYLRRRKPDISELKNGILMKDIPLDQVSEGLLDRISRRGKSGTHDRTFELWETDSKLQIEKELGIDKLEVLRIVKEPNQEGNKRRILERLASDAQRLSGLKTTVENLKTKLEANKKSKKARGVDFETVKEQLQECEETIVEMVDMNGKLVKNFEDERVTEDMESVNVQRTKITEQARKGAEKLGRLQMEVQKIEFILLKLEDERKSKSGHRFSKTRTSIILRDFIQSGRKSSERQRKARVCGCWRPSSRGGGNNM